jgi:hypothetical protein
LGPNPKVAIGSGHFRSSLNPGRELTAILSPFRATTGHSSGEVLQRTSFQVAPEQTVPRYFPVDAGVRFDCDQSNLLAVDWKADSLSADFILPDAEGHALRVHFNGATIVRLLDEMPLSTEQPRAKKEGLVPRHFAYRVEDSTFANTQSEVWKEIYQPVCHYEFITGWGCMDVLSRVEPSFEVVKISE